MRNTDEQIREIMKRAEDIHKKKSSQRMVTSFTLAACVCIVLLVMTIINMPGLSEIGEVQSNGHYGSLLLNTSYMGYVVIGVIVFFLCICVMIVCLHLHRIRKNERNCS